ncbi:MAG: hypothetical protein ACE5Q6_17850 [Dehalococcoidia bacterium]
MIARPLLFKWIGLSILWTTLIALSLAVVPIASQLALLIFGTAPNPRHLPEVMLGEVTGWGVIGLIAGALCVIIAESLTMVEETGFWGKYRGLLLGGVIGILLATFLSVAVSVVQMDSVDAQAVTSSELGLSAALVVGVMTGVAGVILGAVLKRIVNSLAP